MRILSIQTHPIFILPYKNVAPGSGRRGRPAKVIDAELPLLTATLSQLPDSLDAIIATSDLQGRIIRNGEEYLLGEILPKKLFQFLVDHRPEIDPNRVGIFLCGDLFATLTKRGGLGDVRNVWYEFRKYFKWVAGVAGNHDQIGNNKAEFEAFLKEPNIYFLDGHNKTLEGMEISGVSGIISTKRQPFRIPWDEYEAKLDEVAPYQPDVLLLHQTPSFPEERYIDSQWIREYLEEQPPTLIISGHKHWEVPLREISNGSQILNLEARAILLTRN